jgi:hypothetical protein
MAAVRKVPLAFDLTSINNKQAAGISRMKCGSDVGHKHNCKLNVNKILFT